MKRILNAGEIKEKGIEYCKMQRELYKKNRRPKHIGYCKNCPLHICIDHNGLIHAAVMDFSDFVEGYNLMISELKKMTKEAADENM